MTLPTKADVLVYKGGVLYKEDTFPYQPHDIVLLVSHGSHPITLGELEGEEGFGNILDRVYDKWWNIYDN